MANGTAEDDSNLDIILVKESDENSFIRSAKARLALKDSNIPIDIIVYTPEEFRKELPTNILLPMKQRLLGR